jgi:hypothetical protein
MSLALFQPHKSKTKGNAAELQASLMIFASLRHPSSFDNRGIY